MDVGPSEVGLSQPGARVTTRANGGLGLLK